MSLATRTSLALAATSARARIVRAAFVALAMLHTLPAVHHLRDLARQPNLGDAWKGLGALGAVVLLASGPRAMARVAGLLVKVGSQAPWMARAALVAAHTVPLLDHAPRAVTTFAFDDMWKAAGALLAIVVVSRPWWRRAGVAAARATA